MESIITYLEEFNAVTVILRIFLAALAGGMVGLEREFRSRPAGIRTHMMVSLGACLTTMIGVYVSQHLGIGSDPLRIGAQVISGIGFLGAGTILLRRGGTTITGLTSAAGLWTAASIGLAIGVGFYEGAFVTVFVVMLVFTLIGHLEHRMMRKRLRMSVYLELDGVEAVPPMLVILKEQYGAVEFQVTPPRSGTSPHVGVEALVRIPPKVTLEEKIEHLSALEHVVFALQNL